MIVFAWTINYRKMKFINLNSTWDNLLKIQSKVSLHFLYISWNLLGRKEFLRLNNSDSLYRKIHKKQKAKPAKKDLPLLKKRYHRWEIQNQWWCYILWRMFIFLIFISCQLLSDWKKETVAGPRFAKSEH